MIETNLIEQLESSRDILDSALNNYLGACSAIQSHCIQTPSDVLPRQQLVGCVVHELLSFTSYRARIKRAEAALSNTRNDSSSLVPIHALPSEILSRIFNLVHAEQIGCRASFFSRIKILPAASDVLSHVCSRWRRVAIGTPTLWSFIDMTPRGHIRESVLARTETYADRSGQLPLQVCVHDDLLGSSEQDKEALFEFLSSISAHISSLELSTSTWWTDSHFSMLHSCFQNAVPGNLNRLRILDKAHDPDERQYHEPQVIRVSSSPREPQVIRVGTPSYEPQVVRVGSPSHEPQIVRVGSPSHEPQIVRVSSPPHEPQVVRVGSPSYEPQVIRVTSPPPVYASPRSVPHEWLEQELEDHMLPVSILQLRGAFPRWESKVYHGLVELRLALARPSGRATSITTSQLVAVLVSSPGLRIFYFDFPLWGSGPEDASVVPVHLEALEELGLGSVESDKLGALLCLLVPGVKMLQLSLRMAYASGQAVLNNNIKDFFARSNISNLYIHGLDNFSWLAEICRLAPHLQVLVLDQFSSPRSSDQAPIPNDEHCNNSEATDSSANQLYLLDSRIPVNHLQWLLRRCLTHTVSLWRTHVRRSWEHMPTPVRDLLLQNCQVVNTFDWNAPKPTSEWYRLDDF